MEGKGGVGEREWKREQEREWKREQEREWEREGNARREHSEMGCGRGGVGRDKTDTWRGRTNDVPAVPNRRLGVRNIPF